MTRIEDLLRQGPTAPQGPHDDSALDEAVTTFLRRAEAERLVDVAYTDYDAPIGRLMLAATDTGLVRLDLRPNEQFADELAVTVSPRVVRHPAKLDAVRRELDEYFEGRRHVFEVPVDWRLSRGFRLATLQRLFHDVGYGQTVSYKDLAGRVGKPTAFRAVGAAMATNPVPIVVPCHRVLDSAGRLHGYGGGLPMKEALLRLEGAMP
jgi:methylated-DNA-[protein]-cysteine S-methyltransferase